MFGLLKDKPKTHYTRRDDVMWLHEAARLANLPKAAKLLVKGGTPVVVSSHRASTMYALREALGDDTAVLHLIDRHRLNPPTLQAVSQPGKRLVLMLAELGSTPEADDVLLENLNVPQMKLLDLEFHTSLDDPLLKDVIKPNVRQMMISLGMKADEPITHRYVTRALETARTKARKQ